MGEARPLLEKIRDLKRHQGATQRLDWPIALLWSLAQAIQGKPRMQRWSTIKNEVGPLVDEFTGTRCEENDICYLFWVLQKKHLWEVEGGEGVAFADAKRWPSVDSLESIDPLVGLSEQDYLLLGGDFEQAAWVVDTALLLFFTPRPPRLLKSFGLDDFMGERAGAAMRPAVGEICENRRTISEIYGGNNTTGITPFADGVLAVFSDDNGPYADSRIPETNWIAYTGDGLSGDQIMARGNKSMELCQKERRALRYWHKLSDGRWSFETWAVVVQCRRRWGVDQDKKQRKEFVWILAPVSSPLPSLWPQSIIDALNEDDGVVQDDTLSAPPDGLNGTWEEGEVNVKEKYQKLSKIAREVALKREQKSRISAVERYFRSYISRRAVIERSRGCCENPDCLGHPTELTSTGMPILEVDHVRDLSLGGSDVPENMIALCPNCHALKTRGVNREILRKRLKGVAQDLHRSFSSP